MNWPMISVSQLCIHAIDCVNKTAPTVDYETPFKMIRTTNVKNGFIHLEKVNYVSESVYEKWTRRAKPHFGDVILTREAPVGEVGRFTSNDTNIFLGQRLFHFRPNPELLDWNYLAYVLQSPLIQGKLRGMSFGATVQHIKVGDAENLQIPCPPIKIQRKIGDILSSYDDLIENNRRRIVLLESAARLLYQEWFIHLRFPGHEHITITDGLPEGWNEVHFDKVLCSIESGSRPSGGAKDEEGIPSIGAENVLGLGLYDYSKEKYVSEDYFGGMKRGVVRDRDVVLYKDGANIGRASYFGNNFPHERCAVNEHVFILRSRPAIGQTFLYFWMIQSENRQAIANLNSNTAQPGINQKKLKNLQFLLPPEHLTRKFNDAVESQIRQIFTLARMNRKLKITRDLLLPRLMSGEITL